MEEDKEGTGDSAGSSSCFTVCLDFVSPRSCLPPNPGLAVRNALGKKVARPCPDVLGHRAGENVAKS